MTFVELHRSFVPVQKDQEPILDIGRVWGRKIAGWLDWKDLLERRRVVLLAEASSGKSAEFQNQMEQLRAKGKSAFYLRIEELADRGFEAALDSQGGKVFQEWLASVGVGWFFLDSIDEARLNRKSFETALKRLARELGTSLERAHVLISCRVTDWKGLEDRAAIARWLPAREAPSDITTSVNGDSALLDPIFDKTEKTTRQENDANKKTYKLLVVQLVPLSTNQYRTLAHSAGVNETEDFVDSIEQKGLEAFAERPGDLLDLAEYWRSHRCFGTFAAMVEYGITRKLKELDPYRPDNADLSLEKARVGAERLAAGLTFCKSFTLRASSYDPDPSLAAGALDPASILDDWSDAERNALLRRGAFAPATYGRIRYHHRSTQEYLTAAWLLRLLNENCPQTEVWELLFADRYGVKTVVPSLRPAAAWLALWNSEVLDEVVQRDPLTLLQYGDPGSLSLQARQRVLHAYASKHAAGEISDDSLDRRSLRAFAHPRLKDAIQKAWKENSRTDFRLDLLRLVREGSIKGCEEIVRSVISDKRTNEYHRIAALQALQACGDIRGLSATARTLVRNSHRTSARLASGFAAVLYPNHLSMKALLTIIERSKAPRSNSTEGFTYSIEQLYAAAPDAASRSELATGLAEMCLAPPFVDESQPISKRHQRLAENLYRIAQREAKALENREMPQGFVRLLMAVERAEGHNLGDEESLNLHDFMQLNPPLNQALFWADVQEQRNSGAKRDRKPTRFWQVTVATHDTLWKLTESDLPWLMTDIEKRKHEDDRRIALSAVFSILRSATRLSSEAARLREVVSSSPTLVRDLEDYLSPPAENEESAKRRLDLEKRKGEREKHESKARGSWIKFRNDLRVHPNKLTTPRTFRSWSSGIFRFRDLTRWLEHRANADMPRAALKWRLLTEAFGRNVAESYRDGMQKLWRAVVPERPLRKPGGTITTKWQTILAFAGVGVEAAEDPEWASHLSDKEAIRATKHGCMSEQGYPEWIEGLVSARPGVVLPILKRHIATEWTTLTGYRSDFLYHYSTPAAVLQQPIQQMVLERFLKSEGGTINTLDRGLRIISSMHLNETQREKVVDIARQRLGTHIVAEKDDFALRYFAALLLLQSDRAVGELADWLEVADPERRRSRVEQTLATLFDRNDPIVPKVPDQASVRALEQLLHLAYSHIRPRDDARHEGSYEPNTRDHAEDARNTILAALLDRPGADAFRAMHRAANHPTFADRSRRFRELTRGKAERDAEPPAWTAAEVRAFERHHTAPVKTGADLLRVVVAVLDDIVFHLTKGDVSSRSLLERAKDEEEVQNWLVEQMNFRARGRFRAYREAEVALGDMPDVIVSSTNASCEVAIEVKHGGKGWSARQLEEALRNQLGVGYLKPSSRRHGVLVVTQHTNRQWLDPTSRRPLTFDDLVGWLKRVAASIVDNGCGAIELRCVGINASQEQFADRRPRGEGRRSNSKAAP